MPPLRSSRPTLDIRRQTYACDLDLHPMSTRRLCGFSPISSGVMWLGLSIFIFYSLVVVLERINLVLLGSIGACQSRTNNKSHRTGGNNAGGGITLYCSAPWSHLETWWGVRLEKSLTLNVTLASLKADGLDAWLSQKQPGLGSLVPWEKLHCLALPTAPKAERYRCWNRKSLVSNNDKRSKTRRSGRISGRSPNQEGLGYETRTGARG